jgi:DMSO/TMAO reductase YedYZ molybdopterin-dependent catalytic subunit
MAKKTSDKVIKKGIHELYAEDPIKADKELWGRESDPNTRRGFLKKSGLMAMAAAVGAEIPFAQNMPSGLIPAALANTLEDFKIPGKNPNLVVLNDLPINAETPPWLLDDDVTPGDVLFIRNNGVPPKDPDPSKWVLTIGGDDNEFSKGHASESTKRTVTFTIDELKKKFKNYSYQLTIECGGNGRSEYNPPAKGNQWTTGAVGCPKWTGIRLKDVLEYVGVKDDAVYVGYYGADTHLSGDPSKEPISRGMPMDKALEDETLIVWSMNDEDIPYQNGYPLRLVAGGWPASVCGKWLERIVVRNKVHDGKKMTGQAYRTPCETVAPGTKVADEDMCIIESMPVKSLITYPKTGVLSEPGKPIEVRGHAWAGDRAVKDVYVSIDFGATWQKADLKKPVNRLAWQRFNATVTLPQKGYYEIWARAVDDQGVSQPMVLPGWNPKGYLNNACHRIAAKAL